MQCESLKDNHARHAASALLAMASGLLMELERPAFMEQAYLIVLATLEAFEEQTARERSMPQPSRN